MNIAEFFVRMSADTSGLKKGMSEGQQAVKAMSGALKQLGIAVSAGAFFNSLIQNSIAAQNAMAQLEARVRSTGGAAGRSVQQLDELSQALARKTTFDDEAVKSAESLLLTFKKVKGDEFDRATAAALDLSVAMGSDVTSAALQLGKALEDPITGLTALRRSGVSFTEAQQDTIKALVRMGDVAAAQNLILTEMESQFGGAAEAARDTLGGALQALGNAWGDQLEVSRESSSGIIDAINAVADALPALRAAVDFVIKGWGSLGVHAALAVEQLELMARALDPRRLWSDEAQAAFEQQKKTVQQFTEAAGDMMVELERPQAITHDFVQNSEERSNALSKEQIAAQGLEDQLKSLNETIRNIGQAVPTTAKALENTAFGTFLGKRKFGPGINVPGTITKRTTKDPELSLLDSAKLGFKDAFANLKASFDPRLIVSGAVAGVLSGGISSVIGAVGGKLLSGLNNLLNPLTEAQRLLQQALQQNTAALRASAEFLAKRLQAGGLEDTASLAEKAIQEALDRAATRDNVPTKKFRFGGLEVNIADISALLGQELSKVGLSLQQVAEVANALGIDLSQVTLETLRQFRDQLGKATDGVDSLGETAGKVSEMLSNVPKIWNAALARFRVLANEAASLSSQVTPRSALALAGGGNNYTFNVTLPNVRSGADFLNQVDVEVQRRNARGGAPIITDATKRRRL